MYFVEVILYDKDTILYKNRRDEKKVNKKVYV